MSISDKSSISEQSRNCVSPEPDLFGEADKDEVVVTEQAVEAGIRFLFRFEPKARHRERAGIELVVQDVAPRVGNVDW
jgi:hypothetical protein